MGPGCQPHKREAYDCFHYFYPWFLSTRLLTFEHFPLINVERHCWRMGPRCQPHKRRIVWFLGLLFTRDIAATWLSFRYLPLNIAAGWWVPKVSLSIIFYPRYCRLFALWKNTKRTRMIEDSNHWPPSLSSRLKSCSTNAPTRSSRTNHLDSVKIYFFSLMGPDGQPLGTRNVRYHDYFLPVFNFLRSRDAAGCGSNMSYSHTTL